MGSPLWGIGTGVAGGAATGAAFGPVGAAIGGGVGGLLGGLQGLLSSQDEAKRKAKAKKMALLMQMRDRAAAMGGDTQVLDAKLTNLGIEQQFKQPPPDYAGLLQNVAGAAGTLRNVNRADQMEGLLKDKLNEQESDAFNQLLPGRGRMRGRLDF